MNAAQTLGSGTCHCLIYMPMCALNKGVRRMGHSVVLKRCQACLLMIIVLHTLFVLFFSGKLVI